MFGNRDIGILGDIKCFDIHAWQGVVLREPSVVAIDLKGGKSWLPHPPVRCWQNPRQH